MGVNNIWQPAPGPEIERTREFTPNDTEFRTADEIHARLDELIEQKRSFDPQTQFSGIRRLGRSYSVAEPFAFFDEPTYEERRANRLIWGTIGAAGTLLGSVIGHGLANQPYSRALFRGALVTPLTFVAFSWLSERVFENRMSEKNVFFHYALMKENVMPRIERKKFGEILRDWTPHRSLNHLAKPWGGIID